MSRDDERDITPAEAAHAESFAKLVERLLGGEQLPAAMDADDRGLVETATVIVASHRELPLGADRARTLVDDALERGVLGRGADGAPVAAVAPAPAPPPTPIAPRARRRLAAAAPWAVAAVCAAAALLLLVTRPDTAAAPAPTAALPAELSSRPADDLVGQIPRARAADASERADVIHADRLAAFRELSLAPGGSR